MLPQDRNKEDRQDLLLEASEASWPCWDLNFRILPSRMGETINICYFKQISGYIFTAAWENNLAVLRAVVSLTRQRAIAQAWHNIAVKSTSMGVSWLLHGKLRKPDSGVQMATLPLLAYPPLLLFCSIVSNARLFVTLWTAEHQTSLSFTITQSLLKFMSTVAVMLSNHFIL